MMARCGKLGFGSNGDGKQSGIVQLRQACRVRSRVGRGHPPPVCLGTARNMVKKKLIYIILPIRAFRQL